MELDIKLTKETWLKVLQTSCIVMLFTLVTGLVLTASKENGIVMTLCSYAFTISWFGILVSGIGWIWSKDSNKRSTLR